MRTVLLAGNPATTRAMLRFDEPEPCGGETVLDLALCLIVAFAVVGLMLMAL